MIKEETRSAFLAQIGLLALQMLLASWQTFFDRANKKYNETTVSKTKKKEFFEEKNHER